MHAVSSDLSPTAFMEHGTHGDVSLSTKPSRLSATSNVGGDLSRTTRLLDRLRDDGEGDSDEIAMPSRATGGWFKLEPFKHVHLALSLREHVFLR